MKLAKPFIVAMVLFSIFFFSSSNSNAHFYNGNELVEFMRGYEAAERKDADANYQRAARFSSYVIGVFDTGEGIFFDAPANVNVAQICAIVAKYLKDNPEKWNLAAVHLVIEALEKAFPKKK
jgi:hypothetical protein